MKLSDAEKRDMIAWIKSESKSLTGATAVRIAIEVNEQFNRITKPITPKIAATLAKLAGIPLSRGPAARKAKADEAPKPKPVESDGSHLDSILPEISVMRDLQTAFLEIAGHCPFNIGSAIEYLWLAVDDETGDDLHSAVECLQREIKRRDGMRNG